MSENKDRIVIIDGNSLINRAYYAIQRPMITKDGFYTQGIYGFLSMLGKIRSDYAPTHMLVAFDRKAPTFRHLEYSDYKAGRRKMPLELAMEMPVLKDVLHALGIRTYETDGFEADDIMGTTAKMAEAEGLEALIVTGDKDALQLATDSTSVIITKKGITEFKLYDDAAMIEEFGFDHVQFIDYKALRGDTSDNIPGIPGVGEKTAIKLVKQFGSVEALIRDLDQVENAKLRAKIEEGAMSAMMSKRLCTIVTSVPVDYSLEDCRIQPADRDKLIDLYTRLEFKTYLSRLLKEESSAGAGSSPADTAEGPSADGFTEFEFPQVQLISDAAEAMNVLKRAFEAGSAVMDIDSDDDHVNLPSIDSLQLYFGGECFVIELAKEEMLSLFKGAAGLGSLDITGFGLGRIYYALEANGLDPSFLICAHDCALAQYVLSPGSKAPELAALLLESFHINIGSGDAQAQMDLFASADRSKVAQKLVLTGALAQIQKLSIASQGLDKVYYDIELPLCSVLASMEARGFKADKDILKDFGKRLKADIEALEAEIYQLAGERFNINSPKQLGVLLFEKLGLPSGKKTKSGYSTNAEILEKLAPDHPIVARVLEYRTLTKLNSTYVEGLLPLIGWDGKIHAHFNQTVTATGRISCTEPNLQNIPVRTDLGRQLRKAFTADSDEYVLIGADYSQIELRVLAHMSSDPTLIQCFNEGLDIHRETASKVFGVPFDEVTSQMRSNAKAVNFGVIYGMSGFGLSNELTITRKEAEKYISDYFERFKDVKNFMDDAVAGCRKDGFVRTLYGRKRNVPEISSSAYMVRQLGERLAMNTPIQGTAADIIKLAMISTYNALKKEVPDAGLILQIHDELIIQAKKEDAAKVRELLAENMQAAAQLAVKLEVSMEEGSDWYELK